MNAAVLIDAPKSVADILGGSGGGARWKRARSCCSVSRISEVMSCVDSRALVKILGPAKGRSAIELAQSEICSRCVDSREAISIASLSGCAISQSKHTRRSIAWSML